MVIHRDLKLDNVSVPGRIIHRDFKLDNVSVPDRRGIPRSGTGSEHGLQ
jgi:Ser/Thr protein kinase RdoA (MazF antagonist)